MTHRISFLLGLLLLPAEAARADSHPPRDRWTNLCPGVRHLHRTTPEPLSAHVLVVDLRSPGVRIEVTSRRHRWRTTSQYGRVTGAVGAINGGFWSVFDSRAEGLVMHQGRRWPGARDDEFYGFFGVRRDGRAVISRPERVVRSVGHLREAVSGLQLILRRGRVTREAYCPDGCRYRQPRTAVAIGPEGHLAFLAVVDGRQAHSRGISLPALGRMLAKLGADRAINLDGGGSAAMYLAPDRALANRPADRREREVLNHIGVFWRPTAAQLRALERRTVTAAPVPAGLAEAPEPPVLTRPPEPTTAGVPSGLRRWVQRNWREILSPRNLLVGIPLLASFVCLGIWALRRRGRR